VFLKFCKKVLYKVKAVAPLEEGSLFFPQQVNKPSNEEATAMGKGGMDRGSLQVPLLDDPDFLKGLVEAICRSILESEMTVPGRTSAPNHVPVHAMVLSHGH